MAETSSFEIREHSIPRGAGETLLRVSYLNSLEGKYTNLEVK